MEHGLVIVSTGINFRGICSAPRPWFRPPWRGQQLVCASPRIFLSVTGQNICVFCGIWSHHSLTLRWIMDAPHIWFDWHHTCYWTDHLQQSILITCGQKPGALSFWSIPRARPRWHSDRIVAFCGNGAGEEKARPTYGKLDGAVQCRPP
jgi:hypothetical protein